ncbi:MAG TPA: tail fiber domain-containing protein, partial [Thermoanaerobaculia bacterium]
MDHERLVLTVAGPEGLYLQREFGAGEAPFLSAEESALPDGIYAYELRAVPAATGHETQWGHLWVHAGSFVDKVPAPPRPAIPSESGSKASNITADTTIPDDLLVEQDLVVKGHACIGSMCTAAGTAPLTINDFFNFKILFAGVGGHVAGRAWAIQANDLVDNNGDFTIRDISQGTIPFRIGAAAPDNALTVFFNGNIGLGTLTPAVPLHLRRSNGTAKIFIEEASATVAPRELLELKNAGGAAFILDDANDATRWTTTAAGSQYLINNQANAGLEVAVSATGNVTILGTLTQGSDRFTKTAIIPVQPDEVLAKLVSLPISTWSRKDEDPKVRHLGPMAQDFSAIFGLGEDNRHIAPLDMAGVSMASIQALHGKMAREMAEKDA